MGFEIHVLASDLTYLRKPRALREGGTLGEKRESRGK